LVKNVEDLY